MISCRDVLNINVLFTCAIVNSYSHLSNKDEIKLPNFSHDSTEFLHWFSGFTDAEGNFLISLDRYYVRFRFKILLHIDDVEVLNLIKSKLGVGIVTASEAHCSFVVQNFDDIKYVIWPIFKSFPLHTNKKLDFDDFYKAVMIKGETGEDVTQVDKEKILSLKNNMNLKRDNSLSIGLESPEIFVVNPFWFIGFLEGEGTFGIKNASPYFQIAQKNTSQSALNAIKVFISTLPNINLHNTNLSPPNVTSAINKNTDVVSLVVNSIDSLYYYILPFLDSSKMYTRKAIDFKIWRIALLLRFDEVVFVGLNLYNLINIDISKDNLIKWISILQAQESKL